MIEAITFHAERTFLKFLGGGSKRASIVCSAFLTLGQIGEAMSHLVLNTTRSIKSPGLSSEEDTRYMYLEISSRASVNIRGTHHTETLTYLRCR